MGIRSLKAPLLTWLGAITSSSAAVELASKQTHAEQTQPFKTKAKATFGSNGRQDTKGESEREDKQNNNGKTI